MLSIQGKDVVSPNLPDPITSVRVEARSEIGVHLFEKIDVCRGLFAFLVVAAHSYDVCWVIHRESMNELPEVLRKILTCTLQSGFYWVMGFFVISGYCIQLSVGRQLEAGRFPVGVYFVARFTRIMPLYYVGLFFTLAIELLVAPARPPYYPDGLGLVGWVSQVFFAQRFFSTFGSFAPSWTITYELFYYVLFGLLAAASVRQGLRPAWIGMAVCVVFGGSMQLFYLLGEKFAFTVPLGMLFGLGTIWFMGALVAVHGPSLARIGKFRLLTRAWPLVFACAIGLNFEAWVPIQVTYLVTGAAFALMILRFQATEEVRASTVGPSPAWFEKTARIVGLASYPTYLFHAPVLLLLATVISHWNLVSDWRVTYAILLTSGIGVGLVLGLVAERPIMAWRAGFLKRLKQGTERRAIAAPTALAEISR
jgi:peptidoglycan/LPS O-acetylase OafA/YrhL